MRQLISLATRTVAVLVLAGGGVAACKSDDHADHDHGGEHLDYCALPISCREIVDVCHEKDLGPTETPEVNECHEIAHDQGTDSACKANHDDCIAKCTAAPEPEGGIHEPFPACGDAGSHDAGHD